MIWTELRRLAKGQLKLRISGDTDAFLAAALAHELTLTDLHSPEPGLLLAGMSYEQLAQLRRAARDSHCRVRFLSRSGLPFWLAGLQRRPLLPLTLLLGALLLCLLSTFTWRVEVFSETPLTDAEQQLVLDIAAAAGLRPGVSRLGLDTALVEQQLMSGFPELFFAEIYVRGQQVRIEVARRSDIPAPLQLHQPGHIVAACDGVIIDVLVRRGTAAVVSGQPVQKGDILVYGWLGEELLAADAIVTARLWAEGYGECAFTETVYQPSGKSALCLQIERQGRLWLRVGPRHSPYELSAPPQVRRQALSWRNTAAPVELVTSRFCELEALTRPYTPAQAQTIARQRAALKARQRLFSRCDLALTTIVASSSQDLLPGQDPARAFCQLEARTEIGIFAQL